MVPISFPDSISRHPAFKQPVTGHSVRHQVFLRVPPHQRLRGRRPFGGGHVLLRKRGHRKDAVRESSGGTVRRPEEVLGTFCVECQEICVAAGPRATENSKSLWCL